MSDGVKLTGFLNLGTKTSVLLVGNTATLTKTYQQIDTNGGAGILNTLNGGSDGSIAIISPVDSSRSITINNGAGNINILTPTYEMQDEKYNITLTKKNNIWIEVYRSHPIIQANPYTGPTQFVSSFSSKGNATGRLIPWGQSNLNTSTSSNNAGNAFIIPFDCNIISAHLSYASSPNHSNTSNSFEVIRKNANDINNDSSLFITHGTIIANQYAIDNTSFASVFPFSFTGFKVKDQLNIRLVQLGYGRMYVNFLMEAV